jgi:hypothetical protein
MDVKRAASFHNDIEVEFLKETHHLHYTFRIVMQSPLYLTLK